MRLVNHSIHGDLSIAQHKNQNLITTLARRLVVFSNLISKLKNNLIGVACIMLSYLFNLANLCSERTASKVKIYSNALLLSEGSLAWFRPSLQRKFTYQLKSFLPQYILCVELEDKSPRPENVYAEAETRERKLQHRSVFPLSSLIDIFHKNLITEVRQPIS